MNQRKLLISLREKNNWKQEYIAQKLNTSQQNVSMIENGRRNPSIILAKKFEILYKTSMEELFPDIFSKINTTKCNIDIKQKSCKLLATLGADKNEALYKNSMQTKRLNIR